MNELLEKCSSYYDKGNLAEVIRLLEEHLEKEPLNSAFWYYLGKAYYKMSNIPEAERCLKKAVLISPESYKNVYFLNFLRIKYFNILNSERPRILLGGLVNIRFLWERGFKSVADVIQFYPVIIDNEILICDDVIFYNPNKADFNKIVSSLPEGWVPDYVFWMIPEGNMFPKGIEQSPFKTVAFIGDRDTGGVMICEDIKFFDVISCNDRETVDIYKRLGAEHVINLPFYTYLETDIFKNFSNERDIDGVFLGGLNRSNIYPAYRFRDRVLKKLLMFSEKYKIIVGEPYPDNSRWNEEELAKFKLNTDIFIDEDINFLTDGVSKYVEDLNHAKIGVIANAQRQIHPMMLETMGCGALAFVEDSNDLVKEFFNDKEDLVLYNEENFNELFEYYLAHPKERAEIAKRGHIKALKYNVSSQMSKVYDVLVESIKEPPKRRLINSFSDEEKNVIYGRMEYYTGNLDGAYNNFINALRLNPYNSEAYNNLGVIYSILALRAEDLNTRNILIKEAFTAFGKALYLEKDYIRAHFNYICYKHFVLKESFEKEYEELYRFCNSGDINTLKKADKGIFYISNLVNGNLWDHMKNELGCAQTLYPEKGIDYYKKVSSVTLWKIEVLRAAYFSGRNDFKNAVTAMENAVKIINVDPETEYYAGVIFKNSGNLLKAADYLKKAVYDSPLFLLSYPLLIKALVDLDNKKEALEFYKELSVILKGFRGNFIEVEKELVKLKKIIINN